MAKMFMNFVLNFIILLQIKRIECLFVSVGDYSNESIPLLNAPECGLSSKPMVIALSLKNECFQSEYKNKTLVFFDKAKVNSQIIERIYKGVDVRHVYESPWVVHIEGPDNPCTGVLISPYWVLTAAHCFFGRRKPNEKWTVLTMGSNTRIGKRWRVAIRPFSFHSHRYFEDNVYYDIGLIRISGFFPETSPDNKYLINSICLPKRDEINEVTENASYYGYGVINNMGEESEYVQKGWVMLNPHSTCYNSTYFCGNFTDDNPRPCRGDSGGPLVQFVPGIENRAVLLGVLSTIGPGPWCNTQIKYANWIPVSKHIDWILKTMTIYT